MIQTRAEYILNQLNVDDRVTVRDLSRHFGCSEVTIRNDLKHLEEKGLLSRTHGGARRKEKELPLYINPGNVFRHKSEKMKIAEKAYSYIEEHDTIFIDDSSIGYYLAEYISRKSRKHLAVITNSLAVSMLLSACDRVVLYMIGGQIGGDFPATFGEMAMDTISRFKADKAFISAHGVSFDAGVTSIGSPQMQVKKAILTAAQEIYLLVDSSKFRGGYVMVVCPLSRIKKTITDNGLSAENRKLAGEHHIPIDIV